MGGRLLGFASHGIAPRRGLVDSPPARSPSRASIGNLVQEGASSPLAGWTAYIPERRSCWQLSPARRPSPSPSLPPYYAGDVSISATHGPLSVRLRPRAVDARLRCASREGCTAAQLRVKGYDSDQERKAGPVMFPRSRLHDAPRPPEGQHGLVVRPGDGVCVRRVQLRSDRL